MAALRGGGRAVAGGVGLRRHRRRRAPLRSRPAAGRDPGTAARRRAGIVAGPADDCATLARYAEALPDAEVTVCRLDAGPATLAGRLRLRALGQGPAIPGDDLAGRTPRQVRALAARAARQARDLRRAGVGDVHVDTDGLTPPQVAQRVLRAAWRASR
ncbi:hypothetical protein AB0K48_04605 [Nonomuraea sp. NPDC055795]